MCLKTAEVLRLSGFKTGLFVSPHISSFRERVQIDGTSMTADDVEVSGHGYYHYCLSHLVAVVVIFMIIMMVVG